MAVYFVLAVVGLALMLVSFLADDVLDGVLDIDSGGLFSTTAAAAALTLFGAAGIISTGIGADARWAIPVATVTGVVGYALTVALVRVMRASESEQPELTASVVGAQALVEAGPSILVLYNGAYLRLAVRTEDGTPLSTGQSVRVVSLATPTSAVVTPVTSSAKEFLS
ncbi:hypothetical protein [Actinomyces oricola]|uniref:hypothetical protein n=1 Tax=Actinomyces oricola TaxID=206043 RepID=UPI000FFEEDBD|nr:hypothetical protein [Actinomyces oricola]